MFLHLFASLQEVVLQAGRLPVILPGQREPAWVRRNAEHARILAEIRAEERAARADRPQRGILARLGLARG